jgi:hypothetical protein
VCDRSSEERVDRVTNVFLDRAALTLYKPAQRGEGGCECRLETLGSDADRELGGTDDIDE